MDVNFIENVDSIWVKCGIFMVINIKNFSIIVGIQYRVNRYIMMKIVLVSFVFCVFIIFNCFDVEFWVNK